MNSSSVPDIPPSVLAHLPNINSTLGVLFLGNIFVAILFAITTLQVYVYFQRGNQDKLPMKSLVFFLWALDTIQFCFVTNTVYDYAVTNFMNIAPLFVVNWSLAASTTVGGASDFIVTIMLAYRIWKFGGEKGIVRLALLVILFGSLAILAGDVTITILAVHGSALYITFAENYSWVWYATFSARAGVDIVMATSIYYMMRKYRGGFKRTNSVVRLIVMYSINTCALTSAFTVLSVVLYASLPRSFVGFATAMQLPKLMLNSLLAILNSRKGMRQMYDSSHDSVRLRPITASRGGFMPNPPSHYTPDSKLVIEVNTHTMTDFEATTSKAAEVGNAF
ncbi:hypothetical protein PHLGIDRAFT_114986 [Phlebiopsis gigantea 11061_1 CR5-6]|uniref:DUF6534 domain-containing protein n=1 Tax=Phlebiopsis gigantea (strain 11061_1 CR5-6) TaxID=745531 RepID=A0A0C3SEX3_PHLG1|nr:hypothetical protein PHLGIDRAFT_114986 [Phlebiopsis gigantea 11061_1 CR5-6]